MGRTATLVILVATSKQVRIYNFIIPFVLPTTSLMVRVSNTIF